MAMVTFSDFDCKHSFWTNLFQNQNCQFRLKFGAQINSNMQNLTMVFTFSVLDRKYCYYENLVQKI